MKILNLRAAKICVAAGAFEDYFIDITKPVTYGYEELRFELSLSELDDLIACLLSARNEEYRFDGGITKDWEDSLIIEVPDLKELGDKK